MRVLTNMKFDFEVLKMRSLVPQGDMTLVPVASGELFDDKNTEFQP
jgi:hypothetical protein